MSSRNRGGNRGDGGDEHKELLRKKQEEASQAFLERLERDRKEKATKDLWEGWSLSESFFREFGEPEDIVLSDAGKILLKYSGKEKEVAFSDIERSKHWKMRDGGVWHKNDGPRLASP